MPSFPLMYSLSWRKWETPPSSPGRHLCKGVLLPSGKPGPSASGKTLSFGAACPWPTCSHAYASPTPFLGSSQGLLPAQAGSPLAGRVLHPLDDRRSFMKLSHPHSLSTRIAWSHYNSFYVAAVVKPPCICFSSLPSLGAG